MSSQSPSRMLKATSDFFRAAARPDEHAASGPDVLLHVPAAESPGRRLSTRIPFLGRSRKKSTRSNISNHASESEREDSRPMRPKSMPDNGLRVSADRSSTSLHQIPAVPSLGSKIVAHLTPSKRNSTRSRDSDSLQVPPPLPRPASPVGSTSSRTSGTRTPRPSSVASTNYSDLFTRPHRKDNHLSLKPQSATAEDQRSVTPTTPRQQEIFPTSSGNLSPKAFPSSKKLIPLTLVEKRRVHVPSFTTPSPVSPRIHPERSEPPSIPLPATPLHIPQDPSTVSSSSQPDSAQRKSLNLSVLSRPALSVTRQRAHTISSPPTPSSVSSRTHSRTGSKRSSDEHHDKENVDMDNATIDQLRQALRVRTLALEDLTGKLQKLTATHLEEKTALEKKVASLEKEAIRKDKEIKGLTWLVVNSRPGSSGASPGTVLPTKDPASRSMTSLLSTTDHSSAPSSLRPPQHSRLMGIHTDDSGAESYTSGGESPYGSGAESLGSFRGKRVKRTKVDVRSNLSQHFASRNDLVPPDLPHSASASKRSSMASTASSASSYGQPATPTSLLSAIPETPPAVPPKSYRDPAIAAAIQAAEQYREKELRQQATKGRSSKNNPGPPPKTPAPTPAAVYAANLKRGRPPSIAQVLDQSATGQVQSHRSHQ